MFGPIYLDEIHYFDHGAASTAQLAAFASGQVDSIYEFDIASYAMAASIPDVDDLRGADGADRRPCACR